MKPHELSNPSDENVLIATLREQRRKAPEHFVADVMKALPDQPRGATVARLISLWPTDGQWLLPALAGAAAAILLLSVFMLPDRLAESAPGIKVTFELQAPEAQSVELAGSFNNWQRGQIKLTGPDATGHWSATVTLPPGQHEYLFLVDGKNWVTDPQALARRPDGFGHENAILQL